MAGDNSDGSKAITGIGVYYVLAGIVSFLGIAVSASPQATLMSEGGEKCIAPPGATELVSSCVPPYVYYGVIGITLLLSIAYLGVGLLLFDGERSKKVYYAALALALLLLVNFPIGTIIGIIVATILYTYEPHFDNGG